MKTPLQTTAVGLWTINYLGRLLALGIWLSLSAQVVYAQTCFTPSNVFVSGITSTTAQLHWTTSYSSGTGFRIEVQNLNTNTVQVFTAEAPTNVADISPLTDNTPYLCRIQTYCSNGGISPFVSTTFTTGCPIPRNPTVSSVAQTTTRQLLTWETPTDPAPQSYEVQYRSTGNQNWTSVPGTTNSVYPLTGLSPNVSYEWQVRSQCSFGPSSFTAGPAFQTACNRPGLVEQSRGATFIALELSTQETTPVTYELSYRVQSGPPSYTTIPGITASAYNLTGLLPNTNYEVRLRATCPVGGQSAYTTQGWTTNACQRPITPIASAPTGSTVRLQWFMPGANPTSPTEIRYSTISPLSWSTVTTNATSYTLTGLTPGTTYQWQVRSVCATGYESVWNAEGNNFTTTTPTAPPPCPLPSTNPLYGSGSDRYWNVYWTTVYNERYNLRYRPVTSPVSSWTTLNQVNAQYSVYMLRGLKASTLYEWQVQSECIETGGISDWTASATFTTLAQEPCLAPTNLRTDFVTDRRASLLWSDGGYLNADRYQGQYRVAGSNSSWTSFTVTGDFGGTHTILNLSSSTNYEVQVQAVCSPGYTSTLTAPVTFGTLAPIVCANLTPTGLANSQITRSNARFTWNDMVPGTTAETYNLRYRPINTSNWVGNVANYPGNEYPPVFQNLTPSTTYEWQVQTVCPEGDLSPWSALAQFTTSLCEQLIEPATLVYNEGMARLQWSGQIGSTTYPVTVQYRTKSPVGSWIPVSNFNNGDFLTGLSPNVAYEWQARNNCSNPTSTSDWTPIQSFTALGCIPPPNANLADGGISGNAAYATIQWRRGFYFQEQTTFNMRWRKLGTTTWLTASNITSGGFGQYIGNLEVNATYEWQIQTNCLGGGTSVFSQSYIFSIIPGFYPIGNFYTVKNGDWSDYSVWSTGRVPELSFPGNFATPVEIRHQITVPAGYLAPARTVRYTNGARLLFGTGARILLGN
ncbi:fibronectin type III domain-containing protein [Spirosoma sp. BT702]|uniref:Fibronectin type III domain-containing protein n=1 Tax=Spirosoma profusum TaxID=2771354 RepID=A0A926Y3I5_9BACT|nr:fibronectin type III domain-containing protein [Spirosoma profusum]MBD2704132.1 fibronectin type III domain-containing protein [Spirosoma profusum]